MLGYSADTVNAISNLYKDLNLKLGVILKDVLILKSDIDVDKMNDKEYLDSFKNTLDFLFSERTRCGQIINSMEISLSELESKS